MTTKNISLIDSNFKCVMADGRRPNLDEENFKRLLYPVARGFFITINREEITVYRKKIRELQFCI